MKAVNTRNFATAAEAAAVAKANAQVDEAPKADAISVSHPVPSHLLEIQEQSNEALVDALPGLFDLVAEAHALTGVLRELGIRSEDEAADILLALDTTVVAFLDVAGAIAARSIAGKLVVDGATAAILDAANSIGAVYNQRRRSGELTVVFV